MKRAIFLFLLATTFLFAVTGRSDDGAFYSVVPFGAKYDAKDKSFTFTGQYAIELKKLLPPDISVITTMYPKLKDSYEKNFRGLLMKDASGNALSFYCFSAKLENINNQQTITETPETTCMVKTMGKADADYEPIQKVQVKDALQKAGSANSIK